MIGVTVFGLIFTPVFYVVVRWLEEKLTRRRPTPHEVQPGTEDLTQPALAKEKVPLA